jgi:hypothetical protein
MMRKFAVALIATTMLVAPALAADAVKATPAATATTSAPTAIPAAATVIKTDKEIKKTKVAHRHVGRHLAMLKHGKHSGNVKTARHASHVKTAKASQPVKAATATTGFTTGFATTPAVSTASKPVVKTIKANSPKKIKVAHRHNGHHAIMAKNGKHVSHVKTAKVSKPVQHANLRAHKQVAHVVKASKVSAN